MSAFHAFHIEGRPVAMTNQKTETETAGGPVSAKMKEKLYPAVLDLFSGKDFHQVNLREIYKKSGMSPSTIYKYFPSKECFPLFRPGRKNHGDRQNCGNSHQGYREHEGGPQEDLLGDHGLR